MTTPAHSEDCRPGDEARGHNGQVSVPVPRRRTLDEMLENTFASMAIEGYSLTEEERIEVRRWAETRLARRLWK